MNKKILIAIALFIFIFCLMALPFSGWWFNGCDDFHGLYLGFRTKTWKELLWFFIDGHINQDIGPTNGHQNPPTTFFNTYYRPLYCVYLTLQYWAFGIHGYLYYLCNVFFHALNTALLFYLLSLLCALLPALIGALFFAFHPQIGYRFGAIVNLHYYINVFLIMCTVMLLYKYLKTARWYWYLLSCITFIAALFTRESSIVLPVILFLGTFLYRRSNYEQFYAAWIPDQVGDDKSKKAPTYIKSFFKTFTTTLGYWVITMSFLILRLFLYPLNSTSSHNFSVIEFMHVKKQELLILLYDCFGLSWLPWGRPLLRISLLGLALIFFAWLFYNNKNKVLILGLLFCAGLMLWPGIIGHYSPRYMYEGLPFIIAAYMLCFAEYHGWLTRFKKLCLIPLTVFMCFLMFFTIDCFKKREIKMHTFSRALTELISNTTTNRSLCFLSYPMDGLGDQPSDIVRVLRNNADTQIFCDMAGAFVQADSNIVQPCWWGNVISSLYTKNYSDIQPVQGGFLFKSLDTKKIQFFVSDDQSYSLGKKIIKKNIDGVIDEFTLIIDQEILDRQPIYIIWNYETQRFDLITL